MFPDNNFKFSEQTPFLPPRNRNSKLRESWELGGIGLSDPSEDFKYFWRGFISGKSISLERQGQVPVKVVQFSGVVSEISFSFDQNMKPVVAFVEDGVSKLNYYDTVLQREVTKTFEGIRNPKVSLDDKRRMAASYNDVILAYLKGDSLFYRLQRERYEIEHLVSEVSRGSSLAQIGMTEDRRFLFHIKTK